MGRPMAFTLRGRLVLAMTVLLLTASPALAVPAWAYDTPESRATLKGLKAIGVAVETIPPDTEKDGLTRDQLQADVELRVGKAGITVNQLAREVLYVRVTTRKAGGLGLYFYAYSIQVAFMQWVSLVRGPKIRVLAPAWEQSSGVGMIPAYWLRDVRRDVADYVDKFINAYLEQNPKQ